MVIGCECWKLNKDFYKTVEDIPMISDGGQWKWR